MEKFSFGCSWHWTNLIQRKAAKTAPCGRGAEEVNGVIHPIINPSCAGMAIEALPRAGCVPRHLQLAPGSKRTKANCTGYSSACKKTSTTLLWLKQNLPVEGKKEKCPHRGQFSEKSPSKKARVGCDLTETVLAEIRILAVLLHPVNPQKAGLTPAFCLYTLSSGCASPLKTLCPASSSISSWKWNNAQCCLKRNWAAQEQGEGHARAPALCKRKLSCLGLRNASSPSSLSAKSCYKTKCITDIFIVFFPFSVWG